jgi:type I restriction enzyme, S subunit
MKHNWEIKKLSELSKDKNAIVSGPFGSNLKVSDYRLSGVPILRLQNIGKGYFVNKDIKFINASKAEELKYHSFKAGDIALAKLGIPVGKTCIIPDIFPSGIIVADVVRIRVDKKIVNYRFLVYFLNTDISVSQLTSNISGATRPRVNLSDVRNILVNLPPLPEQQRIVSILDKAFTVIDKAKANAQQNIKNAKEFFESYLQSIFKNKSDDWEKKKLGEVIKLEYGKPLNESRRKADGLYPMYGANGIKGRTNDFYYDKKSIIVGRKGSAGEINLTEKKFWPLDVTYFVTFDKNKYDLMFLFFLLSNLDLPKLAKGVKPGINRNEVYDILSHFPSIEQQQTIVKKLEVLSFETKKLESIYKNKIESLEELKKSILQKAFSGGL